MSNSISGSALSPFGNKLPKAPSCRTRAVLVLNWTLYVYKGAANMTDLKMQVQIFRGTDGIGSGQLLPNGAAMALCPDDRMFELLEFKTDTNVVEDRIPMTFFCDGKEVSDGELYNSGEYICLCPTNQQMNLVHPDNSAILVVDPYGESARLDISTRSH